MSFLSTLLCKALLCTTLPCSTIPCRATLPYKTLQGKIRQDGSGFATFKATFQCITYRPFKGEVLDCVVSQVNKVRLPQGFQTLNPEP